MHQSLNIFLLADNARLIKAAYEPNMPDQAGDNDRDDKLSRYKTGQPKWGSVAAFKTLDPDIAVGDLVIVPTGTRWGMTVVKVTEVDVMVDFESTKPVSWVIAKVDVTGYQKLLQDETDMLNRVENAKKRRMREDLRKDMMADMSPAERAALPFYDAQQSEPAKGPSKTRTFDDEVPF